MKKILIVSSWAPPMPGGPQNLYNLFSQFPKDTFAILTSSESKGTGQEGKILGKWLPCEYFYYDQASFTRHPADVSQSSAPAKSTPSFKQVVANALRSLPFFGEQIYDSLGVLNLIRVFRNSAVRTVHQSKANILMGISDKGPALITTWLAARRLRLPYVIYLYDLYRGNNISGILGLLAKFLERPILTNAQKVILTNEGTEDYYRRRYGSKISTAVVHNSTFSDAYEKFRQPYAPQPPYRIIFTGHVYWPQEESVLNIIKAMKQLSDLPLTLDMYIPVPPPRIREAIIGHDNITLSSANQDDMPRIQNQATLLFLPLSWNTPSPDIIATATPGKFTDYLASGRPMLIHAPDYAYVSRYAREHDLGIVVDQNDVGQLAKTIRRFLANPAVGQEYIRNSLSIFQKNHEAIKNAEKLTKLLNMIE